MTRLDLAARILALTLLTTSVALLVQRARACSSCDVKGVMISQNDQSMGNAGTKGTAVNNREQPQRGYAVCPVCHMRFKITEDTPYVIYGDRKYYFDSEADKETFLSDPKKYINSMRPNSVTGQHPASDTGSGIYK
ncbi:MAG: YHS domain-containing protein [Deltaproteobacteria bacterium]|nr:YHS domain-containing protein [Deltaproteobacteria bacterium]MCL5276236.1 YHS domain-containing protein [Deltaproteobacteria bacterium]